MYLGIVIICFLLKCDYFVASPFVINTWKTGIIIIEYLLNYTPKSYK